MEIEIVDNEMCMPGISSIFGSEDGL